MFNTELGAWQVIKYTFGVTRGGIIYPYDVNREMTKTQIQAIKYLCEEWDYTFMKEKPENPDDKVDGFTREEIEVYTTHNWNGDRIDVV